VVAEHGGARTRERLDELGLVANHEDRQLGDVCDRPTECLDRRRDVSVGLFRLRDDVVADEVSAGVESD
jgi:hypothetical protein